MSADNPHSRIFLDDVQLEFLKYAPAYAQSEAREAIYRISELQSQGVIKDGVYYIVLADLVGSTKYGAANGNPALKKRIENFVHSSFGAFNDIQVRNVGLFVKEIGDAVLFVFQHFPDVLLWVDSFRKYLDLLSRSDEPFTIRVCVNIGEVALQGVNPLSLAVSQTFKMEKSVSGNEVVLTETAYHVAWPTLARAYHAFSPCGSVSLDGFAGPVVLYKLIEHNKDEIGQIVIERLNNDP